MNVSNGTAVITVDVEEWFNLLEVDSAPAKQTWHLLEGRVESCFRKIMRQCERHGVRMTCFFLGWVAERYPHLVREAAEAGHEIASHGYAHDIVFEIGRAQFAADIRRSKGLLEDIAGVPVLGYRAPGFSCIEKTPWFFEELAQAGFGYDSSVFPMRRSHGGWSGAEVAPHTVDTPAGRLVEFPLSTVTVLGQRWCMFGGGYLRLFPKHLIRFMAKRVVAEGRPLVTYIHPREVDPSHPRLPMGWKRSFQSYVGLASVTTKMDCLMDSFSCLRLCDLLPSLSDGNLGSAGNPR